MSFCNTREYKKSFVHNRRVNQMKNAIVHTMDLKCLEISMQWKDFQVKFEFSVSTISEMAIQFESERKIVESIDLCCYLLVIDKK